MAIFRVNSFLLRLNA